MKPHLRLLAIHSKEFASREQLLALSGADTDASIEAELLSFALTLVGPEHALNELASNAHRLDGLILCCDLRAPLSSSLGLAVSFAEAASLPLLSVLMLSGPSGGIESFENQLREYIAALGIPADEVPLQAFATFSFSAPPAEWLSVLTESAQQRALRRWSSRRDSALRALVLSRRERRYLLGILRGDIQPATRYEPFLYQAEPLTLEPCEDDLSEEDKELTATEGAPFYQSIWCQTTDEVDLPYFSFIGEVGTLPEVRQMVARIYSLPTSAKPLFAPPQKERSTVIHRSFGPIDVREAKAKLCLIPPTQAMQAGAEATALITFARTSPKQDGVTIRSFLREAPGLASSWLVGDCFRWSCDEMTGLGVVVRVVVS